MRLIRTVNLSKFMRGSLALSRALCLFAALPIFLAVASTGCATYQSKISNARELVAQGKPNEAITLLEPLAHEPGKDQLVYMLDYATALQQAGRYKESAKMFGEAEKIADVQDYTSLSREAGSILLNEEMVQYKGEDFENVLINAVNAVNFIELADIDSALVEVRRLNNKLYRYKTEAKRNYEQNPYAFYLGAILWEADKKWDDAYIAYKKAYELAPDYPPLKEDLVRAALKAQRPEEVDKWKKLYPEVQIKPEWKDNSLGELVLIYQQGWGPRKHPHPEQPRFPKLYPVPSSTRAAQLQITRIEELAPAKAPASKASATLPALASNLSPVRTERVFHVEQTAIKVLDDAYAALVARRVGGVVAKAVVADQVRQKNELLGFVTLIALNATDRADLRQWSTLPESFQIARVNLKPGKYRVRVQGLSGGLSPSGEEMPEREIEVRSGKKAFVTWRSVR